VFTRFSSRIFDATGCVREFPAETGPPPVIYRA
jgi:hypothetical protein